MLVMGAFCPCAKADAAEKELFFIAQKAFDDGFYDVALRYIQDFLKEFPASQKRLEAHLLMGQCYFFKAQHLKAFEVFKDLLQYTEFRDATLFWLGETYLKGKDYAQAEKHYRQLIDVYPDSIYTPQAYYSLGWSFFEQKDYAKASEYFQKLVTKFPMHVLNEDASFKQGECAYNRARYEEAIEYFKDYVQRFPPSNRHDQAYFYIAESHYYLEDFRLAAMDYEKSASLSQDPKLGVISRVGLGWSYLKLGDFERSRKCFEEALTFAQSKGVESDEIYLGQASLFTETKEEEKALQAYEHLIQQFPQSGRLADAYLGQANTLYSLKHYGKAIEAYRSVIEKFSKNPEAQQIVEKSRFGLAWTYLKAGQMDLSIKSFQEIMDQTDNKIVKVSALTQIGDAYQDLGQWEKALEVYDRVLRDYPDTLYTDYVQYQQGITLLKMDKFDAAILSLKSLKANFPDSKYLKEVSYYLGLAYFKKGDWASCQEEMEAFMKEAPTGHEFLAEAHYILALSFFNLRGYDKALKVFQEIAKVFPGEANIVTDAQLGAAKTLYNLGNVKEAVKKFKIILNKYPNTDTAQDALLWLGSYYLESSDFGNAVLYYERLIHDFPKSEKIDLARLELGLAYQAQGMLDKALNQLRLIDDPRDKALYAKAKLAIADIFSKEVDEENAIQTYLNIVESCPEFKRDAYVKIAKLQETHHRYEEAIEAYQEALKADVGLSEFRNAELQFYVGDLYEMLNRRDQAVASYLKIPYLYSQDLPWVTKAYLRAARIFEDKSDWEGAQAIYQKVIDLDADEMKFAQERLEWIRDHGLSSQN